MRRLVLSIVTVLLMTTMIALAARSYRSSESERTLAVPVDSNKASADSQSQAMTQSADIENQPTTQYLAGYKLGECLAADGCQVFEGTILSVGPATKQTGVTQEYSLVLREVIMTVDENFGGAGNVAGQRVSVLSIGAPTKTKTALGPWNAWENVQLAAGAKLMVALWGPKAQRANWQGAPEKVALATSDLESFASLQEIARRHAEVEAKPEELLNIVRNGAIDQQLLGYAMAYTKKKLVLRNVDTAARVLGSLLTNDAIPAFVRQDIPAQLMIETNRLSEKARDVSTRSLVVAAANDNTRLSESAIDVLVQLSDQKELNLKPFLTGEYRNKLLANYQALLNRRGGARGAHRSFESQIGITEPN